MSRQSTTRDMHTYVMRTEMNPYIVDTPTNNLLLPWTWGKSKETADGATPLTRTEKQLAKVAAKANIENKNALDKAKAKLLKAQQQNNASQNIVDQLDKKSKNLARVLNHAAPKNTPSTEEEDEPE